MSYFSQLLSSSVVAGTDPSGISNKLGWWRGDSFDATADTTEIATWPDQSGLSRDLTALAVSPNRQIVSRNSIDTSKTSVKGLGKRGMVYTHGSTLFNLTADWTIFLVVKFAAITGTEEGVIAFRIGSTGSSELRITRVPSTSKLFLGYLASGAWSVVPVFPVNVWNCLVITHASGIETIYHNGNALSWDTTPGAATSFNITSLIINEGHNLANYFFVGKTADVAIFNTALDSTDRGILWTYAQDRYGVGEIITTTKTFVSNGDTNGVLYFLGSDYGQGTWSNPHTGTIITCVKSNTTGGLGTADLTVNRVGNDSYTDNVANSWFVVDLGLGRTLIPNKYSLKSRNNSGGGTINIRNWKLQGSNNPASNSIAHLNAATWTDLDIRVADATIVGTDVWGAFTVTGASAYRWLRILQNGVNSAGTNFLEMGEWEFYGDLNFSY